MTEAQGVDLAIKMNKEELERKPFGYGFGSYSYQEKCLCFSGFIPNIGYQKGFIPNLYFACAGRAREISEKLTRNDSPDQFSVGPKTPPKGAFQRFLEIFGN